MHCLRLLMAAFAAGVFRCDNEAASVGQTFLSASRIPGRQECLPHQ
jgi:hypothetical protein